MMSANPFGFYECSMNEPSALRLAMSPEISWFFSVRSIVFDEGRGHRVNGSGLSIQRPRVQVPSTPPSLTAVSPKESMGWPPFSFQESSGSVGPDQASCAHVGHKTGTRDPADGSSNATQPTSETSPETTLKTVSPHYPLSLQTFLTISFPPTICSFVPSSASSIHPLQALPSSPACHPRPRPRPPPHRP